MAAMVLAGALARDLVIVGALALDALVVDVLAVDVGDLVRKVVPALSLGLVHVYVHRRAFFGLLLLVPAWMDVRLVRWVCFGALLAVFFARPATHIQT